MEKEKALIILKESLIDFSEKQNKLTIADLQNEVINLICLEILKKQKRKSTDWEKMFLAISESILDIVPFSKAFTEAALELFPNDYNASKILFAIEAVETNLSLDNTWDLLRSYFIEKHEHDINDDLNLDHNTNDTENESYAIDKPIIMPLDEIITFNKKISECIDIIQLRKLYNNYINYNNPLIATDFGLKFLMFGDNETALKVWIKGANYGIKQPCLLYDTLFIDSIGQCLMYLLTRFTLTSIENSIKATELSYLYLSRCIELMPKTAFDSYRSRAILFSTHKNPYIVQSVIMNNLGFGVLIEPLTISDFYFASEAINSPHKEALDDAKWIHKNLDDLSIGGKDADEYTLDEMAYFGEKRHYELFKIIEKKYLNNECNLNVEDLLEFEFND